MDFYDILLAKKLNGGGGGGEAVLINKNISANGTYNASSDNADGYKKVVVNVSGGNGYGGDGTWTRPMDMPKLDDMDISGGDVVYMTYRASEEDGFCNFSFKRSSGNVVIDLGHIENGTFVVEDTDTYTNNNTHKKYFGSSGNGYKVIRMSGSISEIGFARNGWDAYGTIYRFGAFQGIKEVYGKLPHLNRFVAQGVKSIEAVHLGNAPLTSCESMFYDATGIASVDAKNWDVSGCTSMRYMFANTLYLHHVDVSSWSTANVTNCLQVFFKSGIQTIDISSWNMSGISSTEGAKQMFQGTQLVSITIPSSLSKIWDNMLNVNDQGQILEYHFKATTPPELVSSALNGIKSQAIIYVPSASLSDYQTATNWSNYSSYMQGE